MRERKPCDVCKRLHRGRRCADIDLERVSVLVCLSRRSHRLWMRLPRGQRSAWLTHVIEKELG